MPASETFDTFYARTVWNVTSQMRELAAGDPHADHAIREAYARAYQQWYQVSGYRDSEAWVLATAKDAYERRRAEAAGLPDSPAAEARDSGTWPGFFRPAARPGRHGGEGRPADPQAPVAAPGGGGPGGLDGAGAFGTVPAAWGYPATSAADGTATAVNGTASGAAPAGDLADGPSAWPGLAGEPARPQFRPGPGERGPGERGPAGSGAAGSGAAGSGPGLPGRRGPGRDRLAGGGLSHLATRRNLIIAGVAVAALVIAGITYVSGGGRNAPAPAASQRTSAKPAGKPKPHMLAAGRTGRRSAIPWSLVGPGWALAELSTAAPDSAGQASGSGSYTTYLVDPEGGKYMIAAFSGGTAPVLMAWSGDARRALVYAGAGAGGAGGYELLNVRTGHLTRLPLPGGVVPVGFARPLGTAILAVRQGPAEFHLQRYTLTGQLQKSLAVLRRKPGQSLSWNGCDSGTACALSSPHGLTDVWGIAGNGMRVVGNAGGKATRLRVKGSGHPSSCMPLSWWNDTTVLAGCAAAGAPDASRLWLVPDDGAAPTAFTPAAQGGIRDAWLAGQTTYVTSATSRQCPSAPSGPGGMDILRLGAGGPLTIPHSTGNYSTVVATNRRRLLVLTQTSCPGTSSLLWFNPSAGTAQTVLTAPPSEVGVIAAVPFGNGPGAVTNGY